MMLGRLLVVGLGSIGRRHVRLARQLMPGAAITVLRRQDRGDLSGTGADHCVTTLDAALAHKPQAAVIANPASLHLQYAEALADAGVHLLIEKPIAAKSDGVDRLLQLCRARELTLMVGYNLRFSASLRAFAEQLKAGRVGRVLSVRAEVGQHLPAWRPDSDYRTGVSARAELGGGVLLELSHEIDYLAWLFGEVLWVNAVLRRQSELEIDVEDTALLTLGFADRERDDLAASLNMDFVRHDSVRVCVAIGESGTLRWDGRRGTVAIMEQGSDSWKILFDQQPLPDDSYVEEWRHFLACIDGGATPIVDGEDALRVLRVIEAARLSSSSGMRTLVTNDARRSVPA